MKRVDIDDIRAILVDHSDTERMIWKAISRCSYHVPTELTRMLMHVEKIHAAEIQRLYGKDEEAARRCDECDTWIMDCGYNCCESCEQKPELLASLEASLETK